MEALDSVALYSDHSVYEIIIVDDGSTEANTLELLEELAKKGYSVFRQENKGPAAARNKGIELASGQYILFLDSDNKIRPSYIEKGVAILNQHLDVGVVYGNADFFGDTDKPRFDSKPFNMFSIIENNYIDMCSIVRKQVWQQVGGLDENRLLIGHEDWDFWIRIGNTSWKFYYLNDVVFDYRVRANSLVTEAIKPDNYERMVNYVHSKNLSILLKYYKKLNIQLTYYIADQQNPMRSFFKFMYKKYKI